MNNEEIHKLDMKSKDIVEDNISKIEQLFVKKVAKYKEKEDIFHKNKIEKCLFLKIALTHVQY